MTNDPQPNEATVERLTGSLALITAAQGMMLGTVTAERFAVEARRISQQYSDPVDALTHMAVLCAQVLRTAERTDPRAALAATGLDLAAMQALLPRSDG